MKKTNPAKLTDLVKSNIPAKRAAFPEISVLSPEKILPGLALALILFFCHANQLGAQEAHHPEGSGTSGDPYLIATLENLYWISAEVNEGALSGAYFIQTADIDATPTAEWFDGAGWTPIGTSTHSFEGHYDGGGHVIGGLYVNGGEIAYSGFFGKIMNATISNLGIINASIAGNNTVGALSGYAESNVHISNCYIEGSVQGHGLYVGGLVGFFRNSIMEECITSTTTEGGSSTGGLIGAAQGSEIIYSFSVGYTNGETDTGGLVGQLSDGGILTSSYSKGNVTGELRTGGLVGNAFTPNTQIQNCFSSSAVTGTSGGDTGGFCGVLFFASIENSFSTGSVFYSDGSAPADMGFISTNFGTTTGNFFDSEASNQDTGAGAGAMSTEEMTRAGTFIAAGWEFRQGEQAWGFNGVDNGGYPFLRFQGYQPKDLWLGLASDDWRTTENWSENAVPGQQVIIPQIQPGNHAAVVNAPHDSPAQVNDLTVEPGAQLAIAPGGALTVTGSLVNSGTPGLTIRSDATGTGSLIHGSPDVFATVERHITAAEWSSGTDGWHFLSAPVIDMFIVGSDFVPSPGTPEWGTPGNRTFDFYAFDESVVASGEEPPRPWINIRREDGNLNQSFEVNFIPGKGYLVASKTTDTKAFQGELNQGSIGITLSHTPASTSSGWNLLGNPYPSAILWRDSYAGKFAQNAVAVYDTNRPGGAGYVYIQDGDYIPAHQGFFAETSPGTHGETFTFTDDMRTHGPGFMKGTQVTKQNTSGNQPPTAPANRRPMSEEIAAGCEITIRLSNEAFHDEAKVLLHPGSDAGRDRHDALKLFSFHPGVPQVYTLTGDQVPVAINAMPEIRDGSAIALGFTIPGPGNYQIELTAAKGAFLAHDIYLLDRQTGVKARLSGSGPYSFAASPSDFKAGLTDFKGGLFGSKAGPSDEKPEGERFKLLFNPSDATSTSDPSAPQTHIYNAGQTLYVAFSEAAPGRKVEVYDLGGRLIMRKSAAETTQFSARLSVESGIYIVRVTGREGVQVRRIFIP